jgi:hypothetical protein
MKHAIPSNTTESLKVGDRVQIVPAWQDPGDEEFERFVIEVPGDSTRVRIGTLIPGFAIHPTEWIEAGKLILLPQQPTPTTET